jgi:histidine triad (HIT) family protein
MMYPALGIGALTAAVLLCTGTCSGSKKKAAASDAAVAQASSCIFCPQSDANKRSVIEGQKIGETKNVRILLDTTPMLPGHVLITPAQHKVRAHELSESEVLAEHAALQQIVAMYKTKYKANDYLTLQKNGKAAGQSVAHYHKHVYPIASTTDRLRANWNFAVKFFTFGFCSTKLQGEKLKKLQRELTPQIHLTEESVAPARVLDKREAVEKKGDEEKSASDKKVVVAASCALCPAKASDKKASDEATPQPIVQVVVLAKQIGPGHVIIKTTRHVEKAHERTPEEVLACHKALQKVVQAYKTVFDTDDYVQIEENGAASGQADPHFHTHVYAVPKTKHEYMRQMEAIAKYSFEAVRSTADKTPGSLQDKFVKALAAE